MSLNSGDLPYTTISAVGTNPEYRVTVEYTLNDETHQIGDAPITAAIKEALLDSGVVASVTATYRAVTETEV